MTTAITVLAPPLRAAGVTLSRIRQSWLYDVLMRLPILAWGAALVLVSVARLRHYLEAGDPTLPMLAYSVNIAVHLSTIAFCALIVGTVITVAASYLPISSVAITVAIALFIACIKGFLVAGYFMHLMSEKKMIYGIMLATVFFFAGLMFLTIWSMDHNSLVHLK